MFTKEYWAEKRKHQAAPPPEPTPDLEEEEPQQQVPVCGPPVTRDVIDRLLMVDEFKDEDENTLKEFVDSAISPELTLTRIINIGDIRFFRLMTNNLIESWLSTRPPYYNGFSTELTTDKVRFRSEIKVRRSLGNDRERVLLSGSGGIQPQQQAPDPEERPPTIWERIVGRKNNYG